MTDFDVVLERLLTDPGFPAALAADPARALTGYRLSVDELELLRSQVSFGDLGDRAVEPRTSKAGLFGLLAPLHGGGTGPVGSARELPGSEVHLAPAEAAIPDPAPAEHAIPVAGDQLATDYHAHVDADGDGHWDHYVAVRHSDGSVDVYEDRNGDGRVDFIGHDRTGDGILESADYDNDFDGVTDVHLSDTNGDGWMDTRTELHGGS
jgi:hypothetical protein